jgi:hypothetical protein
LFRLKESRRRPKRSGRTSTNEPLGKRLKMYLKVGNPPEDSDMNLGVWLALAEQRCQRLGNLKSRMDNERKVVLEKIVGKREGISG